MTSNRETTASQPASGITAVHTSASEASVGSRTTNWGAILQPIATALITAVFAFAAAFGGSFFGFVAKDRELDIRMVEIGLSILRGQTEDERAQPARQFAIEAIKQYSGLDQDSIPWHDWLDGGTVPFETLTGTTLDWSTFLERNRLLDELEAAGSDEERVQIIEKLRQLNSLVPGTSAPLSLTESVAKYIFGTNPSTDVPQ